MRAFDDVFIEHGNGLPLTFLRALAKRESGLNPKQATGPAWGLMQVGIDSRAGNVLKSYNERKGTHYTKQDMLNPRLNVKVATELLARIVEMYKAEGIVPNWENGNFIGLVTAGWNAGYSRKGGMTRVIRHLKKKQIPVTLSAAYRNAAASGAGKGFVKRMAQKKRQAWHRSVVASTFMEQGMPPSLEAEGKTEWLPILLALLLLRS